jgi:DNA-binding response OmpR family regulator
MAQILIVDDEPDTRDVLGRVLTKHGYQVEYAANGWEALLEIDRIGYDLILLDIMMPGLDGAKFLQILRSYASRSTTPVVIVTALDKREAMARIAPNPTQGIIEKKGAHYYDELIKRVETVIGPPQASGMSN